MTPQFVISPQAVSQLVAIWLHLEQTAGQEVADRVEAIIRKNFLYLAQHPQAGHRRSDLAPDPIRFLRVFSYMIVFRPDRTPLEIVHILHGKRDLARLLSGPSSRVS